MERFYCSQDVVTDEWLLIERDGGHEHGQYFDVVVFCATTQEDAKSACDKLNCLYEMTKKE